MRPFSLKDFPGISNGKLFFVTIRSYRWGE